MKAILAILLLVLSAHSAAREAPSAADDPVLEERVIKLTSDLRCLVCQNQSLADSHADLAIDLKNQVRSQMQAGKSDAEIRDYMVSKEINPIAVDPIPPDFVKSAEAMGVVGRRVASLDELSAALRGHGRSAKQPLLLEAGPWIKG